jgi:hypothetical protein
MKTPLPPRTFYMSTFDQDAIDLQREQAEAAAAAAKGDDAPEEEGGAPAVPGADPSTFLAPSC